jgi:uncharacterized protein YdaU (DUF1376 family)
MSHSPAFQFYPNDWLSSTHITLMSPAEEGAYIRLLSIAWNSEDCGLPNDDNALSILSRLGEGWFGITSQKIKECFTLKDGRLFNERLLKEREKQTIWKEKSAEGGKRSWQVRKKQGKMTSKGWAKGGSTKAEPTAEPKPNSSSSSSSSSKRINNTIPDFIIPEVWFAFIEHRRTKKAKLTDHAIELIFKKLEDWKTNKGMDANEILNRSIENGWTGIFELNGTNKPNKPPNQEFWDKI